MVPDFRVIGWWLWVVVAHKILLSAPVPIVPFGFGTGIGSIGGLGLGLDTINIKFVTSCLIFFCPPEKSIQMARYWGTPPFFTQNLFSQNESEWHEMDFEHNFKKCRFLFVQCQSKLVNTFHKFKLWLFKFDYNNNHGHSNN